MKAKTKEKIFLYSCVNVALPVSYAQTSYFPNVPKSCVFSKWINWKKKLYIWLFISFSFLFHFIVFFKNKTTTNEIAI